jgi:hypothetical protein
MQHTCMYIFAGKVLFIMMMTSVTEKEKGTSIPFVLSHGIKNRDTGRHARLWHVLCLFFLNNTNIMRQRRLMYMGRHNSQKWIEIAQYSRYVDREE